MRALDFFQQRLLSADTPRSKPLAWLLSLFVLALALAPFISSGARPLNMAATICVYIVLVASYDLLLGYTGIVSFAHTMFFGIGAYGVGLALAEQVDGLRLLGGIVLAFLLSAVLALAIGLLALRVKAIFFSMMTLAVAATFSVLASQLSDWTGGEDGKTFSVPELLSAAWQWQDYSVFGRAIDGKLLCYYLIFFLAVSAFLGLLRLLNSPFGRVLLAIRENEFRAEALGYSTMYYRLAANLIAALLACLAGVMMALWLRYVGPKTMLSFEVMTDILLIVVIGGMGSLYGAIVGSVVFLIAQNYLKEAMAWLAEALTSLPWLANLFQPDRWLLWLGVLIILSIYFFPAGIVGSLRLRAWRKASTLTLKN